MHIWTKTAAELLRSLCAVGVDVRPPGGIAELGEDVQIRCRYAM